MANDPNTIQYVIQEDGFWYVASKDRTPGVPEITVSAKGVANGLSTEYNDGYDFGPDSYDPNSTANPPYTQTSGIQEAWNNSRKIYLRDGIYNIGTTITIPAGSIANEYVMIGEHAPMRTAQDGSVPNNGVILLATGTGYPIIQHETANGTTTFGNRVVLKNLGIRQQNATTDGNHGIDISYAQEHIFEDLLIDLNQNMFSIPVSTANANGINLEIDNLGGTIRYMRNVRVMGYDSGIYQIGDLNIFEGVTTEFCNTGFQVGTPTDSVAHQIIFNVYLNMCVHGIQLNSDAQPGLAIYGHFDFQGNTVSNSNLQNNNFLWATTGGVPYLHCINYAGSNVTGYITYSVIIMNGGGSVAGYFWNTATNIVTTQVPLYFNTVTTPSVPASGTAQQNTNSYAVDVYIYGGDVTEIQITKNGTAYTVLSVSSAIAMSGQAYKLNPGDSITVTYTTAPDWEWLSD